MILDLDIIGALTLLACALAFVARWLIDRGLDRRPLFADAASLSGPSRDWYRQLNPKAPLPPEPAPFPGEVLEPSGPKYNPVTLISTRPDGPDPTGPLIDFELLPDSDAPQAAPVAIPAGDALVEELAAKVYGHGGDVAATVASNWRKADGLALAEQIGGAS